MVNGNFEKQTNGWQVTCSDNPICNAELCGQGFGQGYYLLLTSPCRIMQCLKAGGYLKMQVSSLDLNITFDEEPFVGSWSKDVYVGNVTCRSSCCLVLTGSNVSVAVDNISLDDGIVEYEFPKILILILSLCGIIAVFGFGTILCNWCNKRLSEKTTTSKDNTTVEMTSVEGIARIA